MFLDNRRWINDEASFVLNFKSNSLRDFMDSHNWEDAEFYNGQHDDNNDNDLTKMEMGATWTGPTIAGMSSDEQSVRFDILAPGSKLKAQSSN